mmetsp:Transcript_10786/g.25890  ORF Transcript_10786/g.25890 Transcript_10786/m.25890 type:complete len:475 (-) Transcript_10786:1680-3104(-)
MTGLLVFAARTCIYDFNDAESSRLDSALAFYGVYHRHPFNQLIHFVGVPIIVWTVTIIGAHIVVVPPPLESSVTISGIFIPKHYLNMGTFVVGVYLAFYCSIDLWGAAMYTPFLYTYYSTAIRWTQEDQQVAASIAKDKPVNWMGTGRLIKWSLILNALSWYMQIHPGHRIFEGASPAVATNIGAAVTTAPLFAFYEGIWFLGFRTELQQKVHALVDQHTVELCNEGSAMRVCNEMKGAAIGDHHSMEALSLKLNELIQNGLMDAVNSNGAAEKHIPNLSVSPESSVDVIVPHVMHSDHFIGYVWLVGADSGDVIEAKQFRGSEPPSLSTASLAPGTKVKAISYCNLHGLWQTDEVIVGGKSEDTAALEEMMKRHSSEMNTIGASEKHTPLLSVVATDEMAVTVSVTVPHVMQSDHLIEYVWLKDLDKDQVLSSIHATPNDQPSLTAKVPVGTRVKSFSFCNLHGLWSGEEVVV